MAFALCKCLLGVEGRSPGHKAQRELLPPPLKEIRLGEAAKEGSPHL